MFFLKQLEKRRQKITARGSLSAQQDLELTEIDCEMNFWEELLDQMLFEPDEDEHQEEEQGQEKEQDVEEGDPADTADE